VARVLVVVSLVPIALVVGFVLGHLMGAVAERVLPGEATLADGDVSLLGVDVAGVDFSRTGRVVSDEARHARRSGPRRKMVCTVFPSARQPSDMTVEGPRAGLVLGGGRSRRFGDRDKALAALDGRPLLAHAVEGLAGAVDGVVVNCRRDQVPAFRTALRAVGTGVALAPDPVPDRGPVAGLAAGLAPVSAPVVVVRACDRPFVDATFLQYLFERAAGRDGAVPRVAGHLQVAHAVYRTDPVRRAALDALADGDGSLRAVVDRLDVDVVRESEVLARTARRSFADLNTPGDLRAAERNL